MSAASPSIARGALLALLALGVAFLVFQPGEQPSAAPEADVPGASEGATEPPVVSEPIVVAPAQVAEAPRASSPVAARPPSGAHDPCADSEGDAPVVRPSVDELLQLRVAELNDRVRAALAGTRASAALREGLAGALGPAGAGTSHALDVLARAPDRAEDGFDTYGAVLVVLAARALGAGETREAVRLGRLATRAGPSDSLAWVVLAIAEERDGAHAAARESFASAFAVDEEEPAIAFALASRLRDGPDPAAAVHALDRYLAAVPEDAASARTRARLALRVRGIPSPRTTTRAGVTLVAAGSTDPALAQRALGTVVETLSTAARLVGVPQRDELTVFVYPDRGAMQRATCAQGWTGAMFDGALHVDAETLGHVVDGTRMLRHESVHAALHPAVPHVPTWLDEGLAQYVAGEEGGAHFESYALMVREHTWVPFGTMNDAFLVIDDSGDAGLAYHQSLAMVLWLVDRRGERGLVDAVAWLRGGGDVARVLDEAGRGALDGEGLLTFLARRRPDAPR